MTTPDRVDALKELEQYARERGWKWADVGHADLIRRLIHEHREATGAVKASLRQRGQIVALFALMLIPLMGIAAIVVDIGLKYSVERRYQAVADAAALAGAQQLQPTSRGTPVTTAMQDAARQRALTVIVDELLPAGTVTTCVDYTQCALPGGRYVVAITTPSPHCDDCTPDRSVQVTVSEPAFQTTFARVLGQTTWPINRTSVAGLSFGHNYAIVALRPVKPRSGSSSEVRDIRLDGGTQVWVRTGDVGSNSNMDYASCASLLHLDAGYSMYYADAAPTWCASPPGQHIGALIADPAYPIPPAPTPTYTTLAGARDTTGCAAIKAALAATSNYGPLVPTSGPGTVNCYKPGSYSVLLADGNGDLTVLEPGLYYFNAGLNIQSSIVGGYDPTVGGVTVWLPRDQQFKQRNGAVVLNAGTKFKNATGSEPASAPAMTGTVPNLKITVIVQPDTACKVQLPYPTGCHDPGSGGGSTANQALDLAGGAGLYLAGVQYAPSDNVTITGNSSSAGYLGQVWAWTIYYKGNGTTINQEGLGTDGPGRIRIDTACSPGEPCD